MKNLLIYSDVIVQENDDLSVSFIPKHSSNLDYQEILKKTSEGTLVSEFNVISTDTTKEVKDEYAKDKKLGKGK